MSNYQTLYFDLAAGDTATAWRRLLGTNTKTMRAITGTLTAGDTIVVQFTNEVLDSEKQNMTSSATATTYAASPTQSSTPFEFAYTGNFKWVRIVKTGANGAARVLVEC